VLDTPMHVPLTTFAANLTTMIQMVRSPESPYYSPITKIILITPPPANVSQINVTRATLNALLPREVTLDWSFESTKAYAEEVLKVGKREDVPVVDAWTCIWEAAGKNEKSLENFFVDGIHVNKAGYRVSYAKVTPWLLTRAFVLQIVYDELLDSINRHYPELHHNKLPFTVPAWEYFTRHSVEDFEAGVDL